MWISTIYLHKEETTKVGKELATGHIRVAVIEVDLACPSLVDFSVYDIKSLHFLSRTTEELVWLTKGIDVYDTRKYTEVNMQFYRTNIHSD